MTMSVGWTARTTSKRESRPSPATHPRVFTTSGRPRGAWSARYSSPRRCASRAKREGLVFGDSPPKKRTVGSTIGNVVSGERDDEEEEEVEEVEEDDDESAEVEDDDDHGSV